MNPKVTNLQFAIRVALPLLMVAVEMRGADPVNNGTPAAEAQYEANSLIGSRVTHQTDLFTGSFAYSVPIEGAPARNNSQPSLALVYSSSGENGWCGVGWNLDTGYIERNTKDGFPMMYDASGNPMYQYDSAKGFIFNLFGKSAKLLQYSGAEYREEVDTDFIRCVFDQANNRWDVYDKSGNLYRFGYSAGARLQNPNSGWSSTSFTGTFRWSLTEIITATGDDTTITYQTVSSSDPGTARVLYPNLISYNGHANQNGYTAVLSPTHTIQFTLEPRTDLSISYRDGFRVTRNQRIQQVACKVGVQNVRRYLLGYDYSPSTGRSLLKRVTVYGNDNVQELPTQTFTYQEKTLGFGPTNKWGGVSWTTSSSVYQAPSSSLVTDFIDMDGDGFPDRLRWDTTGTHYYIQRNLGLQANGQGLFQSESDFGTVSIAGVVGTDGSWTAINGARSRLMDVNGDGRPDRVNDDFNYYTTGTGMYQQVSVQTNSGTGFPSYQIWPVDNQSRYGPDYAIENGALLRMIDINGDGLPDRVMLTNDYPAYHLKVQLSTGSGFTTPKSFGPYQSQGLPGPNYSDWCGVQSSVLYMTDINGDGLPDRVMLPLVPDPLHPGSYMPQRDVNLNKFVVAFNNGYTFEEADWPGVQVQGAGTEDWYCQVQWGQHTALFDINGDGLPDRVMSRYNDANKNTWYVQLNNGTGFNAPVTIAVTNLSPLNDSRVYDWYAINGQSIASRDGYTSTISEMMDVNGDGLLDRVMADYNAYNYVGHNFDGFWVQTNSGPFPDIMATASNGIGGSVSISYKPSTAWDNRQDPTDPNSVKLLPFPFQTVSTLTEYDGINSGRMTTYTNEGGFYDAARHEFAGFSKVTVVDPTNRKKIYFFHQGGGRDNPSLGEYQDAGSFAKKGMIYRTETYGNDSPTPLLYAMTVNHVNQASLGNGRYFPFIQQTYEYDYPSGGTPKISGSQFAYSTTTGNLLVTTNFGEVSSVDLASLVVPADVDPTDTKYQFASYAAIAGNLYIVDHPDTIKLTSDAGGSSVIRLQKFTYNSTSGTVATKQTQICPGQFTTVTYSGYDTYGLPTVVTDATGVQTATTVFDANHIYPATTRTRITPNTDSAGDHITTTAYDARSGLLTSATDPMGVAVQNTYDVFYRLTETDKTPLGGATIWAKIVTYPTLGAISSGVAVNYSHTQVRIDSGTTMESRTYIDGFGRPIQTRSLGEAGTCRVVSTAYDARGEAFLTTWPRFESGFTFAKPTAQPASFVGYDAAGRVTLTSQRVDATFDANGAFLSKTDSTGDSNSPLAPQSWSYLNTLDSSNPWWIIYTDQDGKVRRYRLDAFGQTNRIEEVDGASTYVTTLSYNLAGDLTQIHNQNNEDIYFGYDDAGNLVASADPHLGQWTYQRDAAGRLRTQTDAKGQKVDYTYNASLSRLDTKVVRNAVGTVVSTATYTYDTSDDGNYTVYKGKLYKVTDREGTEKNDYDTFGRLRKTTRHLSINNQDYTTGYTYNDGDGVTSITYPNSGPTISYSYYPQGTISQVSRPGYAYYTASAANFDEFSHVLQFSYGNGVGNNRSYYGTSKRLQILSAAGGSIFTRTFQYSAGDDITLLSGSGMGSTTVTYDNLHRIKTYTGLSGSYAYDAVGNITTSIESGTASTYGYGSARKQAVKTANGMTYLYDKCGNMIVRHGGTTGSQALDYDSENRLTRFSQAGSVIVEYGYAASGERLWKRTDQDPAKVQVWIGNIYEEKGGKTLYHVYAGGEQICTFEPGSALAVSGGDPNKVGYYYHQDQLTSFSALSGSFGQQLELNVYYPFGRTQTASPQADFQVSRKFTGQILDAESGLYYYNARYYDPELGRFIQADTIIPDLADPQSYNRYSYVRNNPLRYTDPTGHNVFENAGNFTGGALIGFWQVMNPVPAQLRPAPSGPSSSAEGYGRTFGQNTAVDISVAELLIGGVVAGGSGVIEIGTLGGATPAAVPAGVVGTGVAVHGGIGINNYFQMRKGGKGMSNPNTSNAAGIGNKLHYDKLNGGEGEGLPSELSKMYPDTKFKFTKRGEAGADAQYIGGKHPSEYPNSKWKQGNNYADFKPNTISGNKTFNSEIKNGKLPQNTQQIPYNPTTGSIITP